MGNYRWLLFAWNDWPGRAQQSESGLRQDTPKLCEVVREGSWRTCISFLGNLGKIDDGRMSVVQEEALKAADS